MINRILNILTYVFSAIAGIIFIIAIWNEFLILFGWKVSIVQLGLGRMLELSAIFVIFVIALLLKQIREELRRAK
jgi:hypothetical protein